MGWNDERNNDWDLDDDDPDEYRHGSVRLLHGQSDRDGFRSGPITAVALMIPVTYGLEPTTGMVLLAGVYYGAIFGGSTSSILINAPGEAATVATALDGYPLARRDIRAKLWPLRPTHHFPVAPYQLFS